MPRNIVDLSARSRVIRDEPWHLHFWESSVEDVMAFLRNPRDELRRIGVELPDECRIETVIENHDWLARNTDGLAAKDGVIVCNVGGGNVAREVYRVAMYAHREEDVGRFDKKLLHGEDVESIASPAEAN
jgi:hypothetical protein